VQTPVGVLDLLVLTGEEALQVERQGLAGGGFILLQGQLLTARALGEDGGLGLAEDGRLEVDPAAVQGAEDGAGLFRGAAKPPHFGL
jgi:hypothetical protein